jgi:endogenous inhibitor of DNA gyrase (YacG/DUF329 family)
MSNRAKRACQACGTPFYGYADCFYCPSCARAKKSDTVVKIRFCQDCGAAFYGGPRAKRCPDCAYKAKQETSRQHKKSGAKRPLGSIDKCAICGKEYIVISGRQKYCSAACQQKGVLEWQREHKKGYNKTSGQYAKKMERRKRVQKVCVYCQRKFTSDKSTNLCSEYCRKEQKKLIQCIADINRGYKRDHDKYIKKRNEYREKVQDENNGI